jgi:hypothetical protein
MHKEQFHIMHGQGTIAAFLLLLVYLGGQYLPSLGHTLLHTHAHVVHTEADEQDACHRSIYHQDTVNGCDHPYHWLPAENECEWPQHSLPPAVALAYVWYSIHRSTFPPLNAREATCWTGGYFFYCFLRGPPPMASLMGHSVALRS